MKNKAFTLVEIMGSLFVITAIALITAPIVLRILNKSKKETFEKTVNGMVDAVRMDNAKKGYIETSYTLQNGKITDGNGSKIAKNGGYKGNGTFWIDDEGNLAFYVEDGTWCALKEKDEKLKVLDYDKDTCKIDVDVHTYPVYQNGTTVYYNPVTNTKCTQSEAVSTTGTKSGCMKWYAFLDNENNKDIKLFLDHNTSGDVVWNSSGNNTEGMREVKTRLEEDTGDWTVKSRLISASEIAEITGANDALQWSVDKAYAEVPQIGSTIGYFYFDGASGTSEIWQTPVANATNRSKYAWLYNHTMSCLQYGCEIEDNNKYPYENSSGTDGANIHGYWTSSGAASHPHAAWNVHSNGILHLYNIHDVTMSEYGYGVRPVVEISKSILV